MTATVKESDTGVVVGGGGGGNCTSAFTLPSSPAANQYRNEEFSQSSSSSSPRQRVNGRRSPSLVWFAEYWSSSLVRTSSMLVDQICSSACYGDGGGAHETLDDSYRISVDDLDNYDTMATSARPANLVSSPRNQNETDRKWDVLRSVVASCQDEADGYCENNDVVVLSDGSTTLKTENCSSQESIYPTKNSKTSLSKIKKKPKNYRRQNSIVANEEEDDVLVSFPLPGSSPVARCGSIADSIILNPCSSFDLELAVDKEKFLCASSSSQEEFRDFEFPPIALEESVSPTFQTTPSVTVRDDLPSKFVISPHRTRTPPSPATYSSAGQSSAADTYTTISLSNSFAKEFDNSNIERTSTFSSTRSSVSTSATSTSSSFEEDIEQGNLFLDKVTAKNLLWYTANYSGNENYAKQKLGRNSNKDKNNLGGGQELALLHVKTSKKKRMKSPFSSSHDNNNRSHRNPFRRLRKSNSGEEKMKINKKRIEKDSTGKENLEVTLGREKKSGKKNKKMVVVSSSLKVGDMKGDDGIRTEAYKNDTSEVSEESYRYLIRMSPTNYRHDDYYGASDEYEYAVQTPIIEEEEEEEEKERSKDKEEEYSSFLSPLVPLHSNQRLSSTSSLLPTPTASSQH